VRYVVEEIDGEFVVPLAGFVCSGLEDGIAGTHGLAHVGLILHNDDFTERATIRSADDEHRPLILSPVDRRARIEHVLATKDTALQVGFEDDESLDISAGEYEEWKVEGPGRVHVVSAAGGGEPAIWDATSKRYLVVEGEAIEVKGDDA
jgi:hypothetical protein